MSTSRGRRFIIDGSMNKAGGGFTYLVNIVPELARQAPDDRFRILLSDQKLANSIQPAPNVEIDYLGPLGLADRFRFTYAEAARLARDWNTDLYFSASDWLPPNAECPTVVALRNPNIFTLGKGQGLTGAQRLRLRALNAVARTSAATADRVMFVSEDSAGWIGDAIGAPEAKRAVVHHGIDSALWQAEPRRAAVHDRPYILSVSSIYPYKNYVRLIEAYTEIARRNPELPDLVIVGDEQDAAASQAMWQARDAAGEYSEWIHILGEVPYADIRQYYRNASLFVFPSYLETFGHPLLEAMAAEVPLVAADIPVFREVAGDAAFFADPLSTSSLARAMEDGLYRQGAAETLVKRGRERLQHFTWRRSASTLLALFDDVLDEDRHHGAPRAPAVHSLPGRRPRDSWSLPIAARVAGALAH
ncbi:MAG: glycosyltransferase family 1 protein [Myxococcota bacterium]|nr:glycosyltransferase family 1 protein [Myxococcota bacterium]